MSRRHKEANDEIFKSCLEVAFPCSPVSSPLTAVLFGKRVGL